MLVELLRVSSRDANAAGQASGATGARGASGAELARRWLAALMLVPMHERAEVVHAVEREISRTYGAANESIPSQTANDSAAWSVHHPPVQKDGYVEEIVKTYEEVEPKPDAKTKPKRRAR